MDFTPLEELSRTKKRRNFIVVKSTQVFLFAAIILMTLVITVICIGTLVYYEVESDVLNVDSVSYWKDQLAEEQQYWYDDGIEELKSALKISWELEDARNVIIFLTHGIGETALAAARFNDSRDGVRRMVWEDFSHVGRILTSCNSTTPCDAFSLGTALFGGVVTTQGIGGLDSGVPSQNCIQSMNETHYVKSILKMAQESGFRNGFVTTRRVSGPMMSTFYAHTPDTRWECDAAVPPSKLLQGCMDVATQLLEDETGTGMNVVMGGGRQTLVSSVPVSEWDPLDEMVCNSRDGRNYIRDWRALRRSKGQSNAVVQNTSQLRKFNGSNVDFVLGVFANGNIQPPWKHSAEDNHMPDLDDMVDKALEVLKRKRERFLLVIESGNESSNNDVGEQIRELQRLNAAMNKTMTNVSADTLVLALFVEEGNETLSKPEVISGNIMVLAEGPSSYLLRGSHDDTYLAHSLAFALKVGPFRKPL